MLALQGGFAAHAAALERAGVEPAPVRDARELERVDALVLPGGESTAIATLLDPALGAALRSRARAGMPLLGTCAGAVLMAREIENPGGAGLALLDVAARRNAYGRQRESFVAPVDTGCGAGPLEGVFIRAPAFARLGPGVQVLGRLRDSGQPVWIRAGTRMACTFHPELTGDARVHRALVRGLRTEPALEEERP